MKQRTFHGIALMHDEDDMEPMFITGSEEPPGSDMIVVPAMLLVGHNISHESFPVPPEDYNGQLQGQLMSALNSILSSAQRSAGKVINDTEILRLIKVSIPHYPAIKP